MEPTRNPSPDIGPRRPMQSGAPMQRPLQRPVFNDFARPARPMNPGVRPATPATQSTPITPQQPTHHPVPHHMPQTAPAAPHHIAHPQTMPAAHQPTHHVTQPPTPTADLASALRPAAFTDPAFGQPQAMPAPTPALAPDSVLTPQTEATPVHAEHDTKHGSKHAGDTQPKHKNEDGHAFLVGFLGFVLLCVLFFAPFLPGKVLDNFPGSSASFSTGDQALACITDLGPIHSSLKYDSKMGFPVTYNYSTTTTQTATCKGVSQSAVGGHTAQLNPLGGLVDALTAFVIAFAITKIWRRIFKKR